MEIGEYENTKNCYSNRLKFQEITISRKIEASRTLQFGLGFSLIRKFAESESIWILLKLMRVAQRIRSFIGY